MLITDGAIHILLVIIDIKIHDKTLEKKYVLYIS